MVVIIIGLYSFRSAIIIIWRKFSQSIVNTDLFAFINKYGYGLPISIDKQSTIIRVN